MPTVWSWQELQVNQFRKKRQPTQPGDVPITFADVSKARGKLEYNQRVKIAEGIPLFVEWFQKSKTSVITPD